MNECDVEEPSSMYARKGCVGRGRKEGASTRGIVLDGTTSQKSQKLSCCRVLAVVWWPCDSDDGADCAVEHAMLARICAKPLRCFFDLYCWEGVGLKMFSFVLLPSGLRLLPMV